MFIAPNGEGETTRDLVVLRVRIGSFQGTGGQHGLLCMIKGDTTKLLPVAHEMILNDDLVYC